MRVAMIGLGRMGSSMTRRLLRQNHECVVYDLNFSKSRELAQEGAVAIQSLGALRAQLPPPRAIWLMLPAGDPTESVIHELKSSLEPGDIIVDGGNSHFKDDLRKSQTLATVGIEYLDVGVSGGVWGLERGYCLMIGGSRNAAIFLDPIFRALSLGIIENSEKNPDTPGYLYCGPVGSGHFVKMIHNGIEYGMMQALAEGFHLLKGASSKNLPEGHRFHLNLTEISELWRRGSVISSWLLDLTSFALKEDPSLSGFTGFVEDSGEGRWTIQTALEEGVPAEIIAASLFVRFRSREPRSFSEKLLSAMRKQFGGHTEKKLGAAS